LTELEHAQAEAQRVEQKAGFLGATSLGVMAITVAMATSSGSPVSVGFAGFACGAAGTAVVFLLFAVRPRLGGTTGLQASIGSWDEAEHAAWMRRRVIAAYLLVRRGVDALVIAVVALMAAVFFAPGHFW